MKVKHLLYRKYDSLSANEKEYYEENSDKFELNLCDATNTIHYSNELIWDTDGYDIGSHTAICIEAFEVMEIHKMLT